jgi:hypothetical protein
MPITSLYSMAGNAQRFTLYITIFFSD